MVTIKTASGNELTVTPNHPILTDSGWIPAHLVNRFDKCVLQSSAKGVGVIDRDEDSAYPTADEVFSSFGGVSEVTSGKVPLSTPDFHGDSVNDEIAYIRTASDLSSVGDANIVEEFSKGVFEWATKGLSTLFSFGPDTQLSKGNGLTSSSFMCSIRKRFDFFRRCIVHPRLLLLGSISDTHSIFDKDSLYRSFRDTKALCNSTNSYAGGVSLDDIVSVSFAKYDTHVYNLQTVDSCYSANGIITHNCRTALVYEVADKFKLDDKDTKRASSFEVDGKRDPKQVSSEGIYYDQMKKLKASDQDVILGPTLGKAFRKLDDPKAFADATIDSLGNPLTIKELKQKNNELGAILRKQNGG